MYKKYKSDKKIKLIRKKSSGEKYFRLVDFFIRSYRFFLPKTIHYNQSSNSGFNNKSKNSKPERILKLEKLLGFEVKNPEYYLEALTHRSYLKVNGNDSKKSNERLEFLGDSVLNLLVGEFIYQKFQNADEGFLTKVRSLYVNRESLSNVGQKINLQELLFISENAQSAIKKGANTIISDAVEALIGAIYLDLGKEYAEIFIKDHIIYPILNEIKIEDKNYKSKLLEYVQHYKLGNIQYQCISEDGPEHDRVFTVELKINDESYGIGKGKTKKQAEQEAARNSLIKLDTKNNELKNENE